jgi:hypothetical protein
MHTDHSSNKRARHQISDDEEESQEVNHTNYIIDVFLIRLLKIEKAPRQSKLKVVDNNQDSSLDLGNDQIDYKTSTIPKHHQRYNHPQKKNNFLFFSFSRKNISDTNSFSTRPFIHHTSSIITTPSLPDDSQTTDDLLNKI